MKSDVIRKRSRHDTRRVGETPSASPGASRRASPSSGGSAERNSPLLGPDSSTTQPAYSFSPEDYDFATSAAGTSVNNPADYTPALNLNTSGMFTNPAHFDLSALSQSSLFPGPYHPDVLQRSYMFGGQSVHDDNTNGNNNNAKANNNQDDEDRANKRRRMSVDSASEPPSSTTSYTSYASEVSSATTAASFSLGFGSNPNNNMFQYSALSADGSLRSHAFWHPPMLPQSADKSPGCFVHPPMLPSSSDDSSSGMNFGSSSKDFPMDFLHPPSNSTPSGNAGNNGGAAGSGREDDRDLFASYLHPPMVAAEDSPMSQLSSLHPHPPMLPPHDYYAHWEQGQDQNQSGQQSHRGYQQQQGQDGYHRQSEQQQQQQDQNANAGSYGQHTGEHQHQHHQHQQRQQAQQQQQQHQQSYYEQYGSVH